MINIEQLKQEVSDITHEFDRKVAMQVIEYLHEHGYLKGVKADTRNGKLTDEQVIEIKKMYSDGNISWETIGSKFGVSKRTIGRIVHNKSYIPLPAAPKEKEV